MIINSAKQTLGILVKLPLYYISLIIPKIRDLEIIGSSLGEHFADNTKYYYIKHYSSKEAREEQKLVWISKNKKVVKKIKSIGLPSEHLYSLKGIYITLRASKAYISHQLKDIDGALMGGAKIIQLWHGMPLRKIGYRGDWFDDTFEGKIKNVISKRFPYAYYMKCDILLAPCQKAKENFAESFSKSFRSNKILQNIFLSRQPRTLSFEDDFELTIDFFPEKELLLDLKDKHEKIIAWLPTQRRQFGKTILDIISESQLDLKKLNDFCRSKNYLFVIKAHFLDFEMITKIAQNLDFVFVYPFADPYPLLKYTNILITDYSSVFFDFLILNRPILFMCYDIDEYIKSAQFYYDYEKLEIGSICKTWDKIFNSLLDLGNNKDDFFVKRKEALAKFMLVRELKIPNEI